MADAGSGPILMVEDDAPLAAIVARHLKAHGHPTEVVASAEEAERRLAAGLRPALVLLDINLPGDSGWGLLRRGPLAEPGAPPVVVMSAVPVSPRRLREFRVAGYLPKPFSIQVLTDCVTRLSGGAEAELSRVSDTDA
jgi:DNA-binding response OmpR family regulator